ncbi:MAG TPA: ATP-binding cassette domain-containing protein [Methylomusa anaerophila]|uniref:Methionine import ATP-binding protein MetN 2 n=1 Tax=Methylomusa anaerophila TaxID=1930071 RepID=A0A348AES7_9FIRM|nr:ATP-binding cassette domain-containing protein [Methylomusa anaerophila]BBB89575.1 methionine import ATP-binding protein MetN 2 [Methylomusa anaerophila]HML89651.1 ATP-binding cassette domain-containing protein [Methylomusa anaerophila]
MDIIKVNRLCKEFRITKQQKGVFSYLFSNQFEIKKAVDEISFGIHKGEIVGYIGPNGAGKSTTIKMLTGILVPTSGEISVNGLIPHKKRKEHAKNIGVVFGQRTQLWWELPVIDSLNLLRHIYKVPKQAYQRNLELFHDVLGIGEFLNQPVRQLSLGQRMRADFSASLVHNPPILFLDEPTIGLDLIAKEKIREFVTTINREKKVTVILTTHDIGDIERLCTRTIVIDNGKIVYDGNLDTMRERLGKYRTLVVKIKENDFNLTMNHVVLMKENGPQKWLRFNKDDLSPSEIIAELMKKYEILDLTVEEPGVEGMIKQIYQGDGKRAVGI